jgi:hypothetical protein
MKVGDLVRWRRQLFDDVDKTGIVIHMSRSGTYDILIDGVLHRATESMLSVMNENR